MSAPHAPHHKDNRATRLRGHAEDAAGHFPALLVEAERLAATIIVGEHGRRQAGMGEDFWQYRHFREGDTRGAVDWRRSARSHSLYVRENEREAAQTVWLWSDASPSLDYKSDLAPLTKRTRAQVIALAMALLLTRAGERVGDASDMDRARRGETAVRMLMRGMMTGDDRGLPTPSPRLSHASLVLVSDFLRPADEITAFIRRAAAAGAHGHLVQVFDPSEETWPFEGRILFEGLGNEKLLTGRAQTLRREYQSRLAAHRDAIKAACAKAGFSFTVHHSDTPPQTALLALYARLSGQAELASGGKRGRF